MRLHLDLSQQDFSSRLGITISTIARYETLRPPKGPILGRMAAIAYGAGRPDLGKILDLAEQAQSASRTSPIAGAMRSLRAALNLTQRGLADRAGVAVSTVARAEKDTLPEAAVLEKFAAVASSDNLAEVADVFRQAAQNPDQFKTPDELRRRKLAGDLVSFATHAADEEIDKLGFLLEALRKEAVTSFREPVPVDDTPGPSYGDFLKNRARVTDPLTAVAWLMYHLSDMQRQHLDDCLVALAAQALLRRAVPPEEPLYGWDAKFLGELGEDAQQVLTNPESRESIIASIRELADELEQATQFEGAD